VSQAWKEIEALVEISERVGEMITETISKAGKEKLGELIKTSTIGNSVSFILDSLEQ
jgi:hypothetical protein